MRNLGQSSVQIPVMGEDGLKPMTIEVEEINAELVIAIEGARRELQKGTAREPRFADYRVGPGDVLSVIVWGHPDLTKPTGEYRSAAESGTVVAQDGTVFFPYVGVIKVAGMTTAEIRDRLTNGLSSVIENVQLEVRVADFRSQRVYVVGQVGKPGVYNITDIHMTLVEAIARAGGFLDDADRSNVTLNRNGSISRIDILAMYDTGDLSHNIQLRHGDIVSVPDSDSSKIFVMGEVNSPRSLTIRRVRMTLADALSDAGNINMSTADPAHIFIVRGGDRPQIFHLGAKEPDALLLADRFPLQPRDMVYVDTADLVRWNKFISNLLPTRNFFSIDTALDDGSNVSL
ncbi:MAG: sugar transporter [Sphingobacteriia bacterium]|nr:sugar transporter [Sphingobacteriia bacterium]NCC39688.1 sugar transporter [Gammaproteobacteria bacterium]